MCRQFEHLSKSSPGSLQSITSGCLEESSFLKGAAWSQFGAIDMETLACAQFLLHRERMICDWMLCDLSVDGDEHCLPRDSQAKLTARDMELNFPLGGVSFTGVAAISDWFLQMVRRIPDFHLAIHEVIVSPGGAQVSYRVSGTQLQPLIPMFPLGKFVEWEFVSVLDFDEAGLVSKELISASLQPGPRGSVSCGLVEWAHILVFTQPGSRLLEKAIEAGGSSGVLRNLQGQIAQVARSNHGNHPLEKYIIAMPPDELQFIVDEVVGQAVAMASHRTACRIVQRLLQHCPWEQVRPFVPELLEHTHELLTDHYGNFVIQRLIEHGDAATRRRLVEALCSLDAVALAQHWIASHVLRCAFVHASCEEQARLARAVAPNQQTLTKLSRHRHGSFIAREIKFARSLAVAVSEGK